MLAEFDSADLRLFTPQSEVLRQRPSAMRPTRNEGDEPVLILEFEWYPDTVADPRAEGPGGAFRASGTPEPIFEPHAIHDRMRDLPSVFLGLFDRVQQDVPRPCADRLMRLDPSESRIAISSVTETGDEQPLQGILLTIVNVTLPLSQALQMPSPFDERCHDSTEESLPSSTGMQIEPWDGETLVLGTREHDASSAVVASAS